MDTELNEENIFDIGKNIVAKVQSLLGKKEEQPEGDDGEQTAEEIILCEIIIQLDSLMSQIHQSLENYAKNTTHGFGKLEEIKRVKNIINELLNDYSKGKISKKTVHPLIRKNVLGKFKTILSPLNDVKQETPLIEIEKSIIVMMRKFMNILDSKNSTTTHNIDDESDSSKKFLPYFMMNPTKDFSILLKTYNALSKKIQNGDRFVLYPDIIKNRTPQALEIEKKFISEFEQDFQKEVDDATDETAKKDLLTDKRMLLNTFVDSHWKELYERIWSKYLQKDWVHWYDQENEKERQEKFAHVTENVQELTQLRSQMKSIFEG